MPPKRSASKPASSKKKKKVRKVVEPKALERLPAGWLQRYVYRYTDDAQPILVDGAEQPWNVDATMFWSRDDYTPALFAKEGLWDEFQAEFTAFCNVHFEDGAMPTMASEDGLLDVPGHVRLATTKTHYSPHDVTQGEETTLGEHLRTELGRIWFSNYVQLEDDDDSEFLHPLLSPKRLPNFLKHGNLMLGLAAMETMNNLPDSINQLVVGEAQTFLPPHVRRYELHTIDVLLSGRRLWMIARPEMAGKVFEHFAEGGSVPWTKLGKEKDQKDLVDKLQLGFVEQREGETLLIPAGWVQSYLNVTETASATFTVLRFGRLPETMSWPIAADGSTQ